MPFEAFWRRPHPLGEPEETGLRIFHNAQNPKLVTQPHHFAAKLVEFVCMPHPGSIDSLQPWNPFRVARRPQRWRSTSQLSFRPPNGDVPRLGRGPARRRQHDPFYSPAFEFLKNQLLRRRQGEIHFNCRPFHSTFVDDMVDPQCLSSISLQRCCNTSCSAKKCPKNKVSHHPQQRPVPALVVSSLLNHCSTESTLK